MSPTVDALGFLPEGIDVGTLVLLFLAAFAAGWIDAVVGGGGLLQLPALLLVPGITPVQALATNKLASIFGTASASVTYYRKVRPDLRTTLPMAAVALITLFKPALGAVTRLKYRGSKHLLLALAIGACIGFYDGLLGPGTGTFLIISLVGFLGYDFLRASAKAKIVNLATNLGALCFFIPLGAVLYPIGLVMGAANLAGGYLGSRMAIAKGTRFIRVLFLVVVGVLIVKLGIDVWNENLS